MAYVVTPSTVARDRYQRCFASSIFDPPDSPKAHQYPAGKRRDQTVGELFGDEQEGKNLKQQMGTFVPKDDGRSAREKKQDFLSSHVLPTSAYEDFPGDEPQPSDNPFPREFSSDPVARRLQENTSNIFSEGGAPAPTDEGAHARWAENKLRPTSFRWYQVQGEQDGPEDTAAVRALHEKSSTVFQDGAQPSPDTHESERAAVQARLKEERQERELEHEADEKRRTNCYYSDLFGRPTPMPAVGPGGYARKPVAPEDKITVHGDWSDARTEIERGATKPNMDTPAARKLEEFHHDSIFGATTVASEFPPPAITHHLQMPDVMDNSKKVSRKPDASDTKTIHQAHMQSSVVDQEFYQTAAQRTSWEVAEVHVSGLAMSENNETIATKVKAAGFHVIRVNAAMDPVNNTCKGTCRLQVRYNPNAREHPVGSLLRTLEEKYGLRGEM